MWDIALLRRSCAARGIVRTSNARVHCQRAFSERLGKAAVDRIGAEVFITTRFLTRPLDVASFSYQPDLSL